MLKLIRNTLADRSTLQTPTGKICWKFLQELNKLQEAQGLRLGNKLKMAHIRGCEETVEFLRTIDAAFDVLNSRNPLGKGYKAPMRTSNKERAEQILLKAQKSLLELKDEKGIPVHAGKRKTCVVGFIASCISVWNVFQEAVCKPNAQCRYLLTYKLSQDHLKLFFSAVRARGGFNNNPTARQFTAAYKRLLVKTPAAANTLRRYDLKPVEHAESEHDYQLCPNVDAVSEYKEAAINYIAGFVVKKIKQKHNCMPCAEALTSETTVHPFVLLKTRGARRETEKMTKDIVRHQFTKLINFHHQ
ncbi:hypothetical protein JOQ06_010028 [Pogonophryne albipinna]|uniref:Uncharacterized protein n=1 Tax=Pogonophryne albipinna TaxID=1090488 RepID=A0AAD6A5J1_9TELE|nr:hypothetical protein JOQ06_010028 [Pogonophryne albipinna]